VLHRKAKAEPAFRFYPLYDKIYCEDIFRHAYTLARANAGVPGMDGMTFAAIEASGLDRWVGGLARGTDLEDGLHPVSVSLPAAPGQAGTIAALSPTVRKMRLVRRSCSRLNGARHSRVRLRARE
jgi:hypothetical protein